MSNESVPANRKAKRSHHAIPRLHSGTEWPIMAVLGAARDIADA